MLPQLFNCAEVINTKNRRRIFERSVLPAREAVLSSKKGKAELFLRTFQASLLAMT